MAAGTPSLPETSVLDNVGDGHKGAISARRNAANATPEYGGGGLFGLVKRPQKSPPQIGHKGTVVGRLILKQVGLPKPLVMLKVAVTNIHPAAAGQLTPLIKVALVIPRP